MGDLLLKLRHNTTFQLLLAALLGICCAWLDIPGLQQASDAITHIFISLMKLVSLPIIFFSLVATLTGLGSLQEIRVMGSRLIRYTLLTTLIAASVALLLYTVFDPAHGAAELLVSPQSNPAAPISYWDHLMGIIPDNILGPFVQNNVLGVLFIALLLSGAILALEGEQKQQLHTLFKSLFAAVMKMTSFILKLMPIAVWAFVSQFAHELKNQALLSSLSVYLVCILLANLIQALIVLPALLKAKGVSPLRALQGMWPALTVAFFAKSSSAALPSAMTCAEQKLGIKPQVARFSLPLCITINMNACAAFILITVLFVAQSHGMVFSNLELASWIVIATIAAIGNAGVPMGCYMLSSAFLTAMGVPLQMMVLILPFYALIDMLESAINVWSDACVTTLVNQDMQRLEQKDVIAKPPAGQSVLP